MQSCLSMSRSTENTGKEVDLQQDGDRILRETWIHELKVLLISETEKDSMKDQTVACEDQAQEMTLKEIDMNESSIEIDTNLTTWETNNQCLKWEDKKFNWQVWKIF